MMTHGTPMAVLRTMSSMELLTQMARAECVVADTTGIHPRIPAYYVARNEMRRIARVMLHSKGQVRCPKCRGSGHMLARVQDEIKETCRACHGIGIDLDDWRGWYYETCAACKSQKEIVIQEARFETSDCERCGGKGIIKREAGNGV